MKFPTQPGQHPDAEQLSAFAEHALPPHELQQTLAHLATCPGCRALVYLAQQANPVELELPQPAPAPHRWFSGWNLLWPTGAAAALACLLLLTLHLRNIPAAHPAAPPTTTASIEPTQPPALSAPPPPSPSGSAAPLLRPRSIAPPRIFDKKTSPIVADSQASTSAIIVGAALSPPSPSASTMHAAMYALSSGAISGLITDQTGAAIRDAHITATNTDTGAQLTRDSTDTGLFSLAPLKPGPYTIETNAAGFQKMLQPNITVAPQQQLALNMKLAIGSSSQSVTVASAAPALQTADAALAGTIENQTYTNLPVNRAGRGIQSKAAALPPAAAKAVGAAGAQPATQGVYAGSGATDLNENYIAAVPAAADATASAEALPLTMDAAIISRNIATSPTLPSHHRAISTLSNSRHSLAIDSAGALFRSEDSGVTWHLVQSQWQGRATHLAFAITPNAPMLAAPKPSAAKDSLSSTAPKALPKPAVPEPSLFQLTTSTGATYTSLDGQTWHQK